jgi:hypothetical protein
MWQGTEFNSSTISVHSQVEFVICLLGLGACAYFIRKYILIPKHVLKCQKSEQKIRVYIITCYICKSSFHKK